MREIPREPDNQRFLLKAIGEAGRELAEELYGIKRRDAIRRDADGWSYLVIAAHVRDHERMTLSYIERILSRRTPALEAIDTERVLDDPSLVTEDIDRLVSEFLYLRRDTQLLLNDLQFHHLIERLHEAQARVETVTRTVPAERWDDLVHSSDGAWRRRDLLAHMAGNDRRQLIRVRVGAGIPHDDDGAALAEEQQVH